MMFDTTSGRSKSLYAIENTVTSTATFRTPIVAKLNSFATIVRLCHAAAIWFKARSMTECFTGRAQLSPSYFYDSSKEKTDLRRHLGADLSPRLMGSGHELGPQFASTFLLAVRVARCGCPGLRRKA